MALLKGWGPEHIDFALDRETTVRLSAQDLFECAPFWFDPESGQRLAPLQDAPAELEILGVAETETGWRVDFAGLGGLAFRFDDLAPYLSPRPLRPTRVGWLTPPAESLTPFDYETALSDAETLRGALTNLARFGWVRLTGAPGWTGELERFIPRFGHIRETNYGRLFDVRVKSLAENLAYTARGLEPHTDNPYRDPVPGLQILHCIADSQGGGENRLVDGLGVAEALRAADREAFDILSKTPVRFSWSDATTELVAVAPVIGLDRDGGFAALRFNHRSFKAIEAGSEPRTAWRAAYRRLASLINAPEHGVELKLAAGDMLLMDNHRLLHGRLAFRDQAGSQVRHLQGAYAEQDGLFSTLARLNRAAAERRVGEVEALFAAEAMSQGYGEALSIREHMLQSAELAAERGLGAPLVAAGLLHDLGWGLGEGEHEHSTADLLEPVFGEAVSEPVRLHVAAKRYLVANEADYRARLSAASVETLRRQGGPFTPAESRAFEAGPGLAAALELRRIDDDAKRTDHSAPPFSRYRDLLVRLALAHLEA